MIISKKALKEVQLELVKSKEEVDRLDANKENCSSPGAYWEIQAQ